MKKIAVFLAILAFLVSKNDLALAQDPLPPGWNKETNLDWFEICSPDDYDPYVAGFDPVEFPYAMGTTFGNTVYMDDLNGILPAPYVQEGVSATYDIFNQCSWRPYVEPMALPGDTYDEAHTAAKEFIHPVQYADVSFGYYCNDSSSGGMLWRPYRIVARWDDGVETEVDGDVCGTVTPISGYVTEYIAPRSGHDITRIQVYFDTIDIELVFDFLQFIPMPTLWVDRLLIRGFYPQPTPTPTATGTPTATRTPAPSSTPTITNTPRPIWDITPTATITGTPPTPIPASTLPRQYSTIPTSIPPLRFPAWPSGSLFSSIPTPQAISFIPLIPTPAPITPTELYTPAPLDFSIIPTPDPSVATPTPWPWTQKIISFTEYLSNSATMNPTQTITVLNAPADYAPDMPRPFANVGYTFEQMEANGQQYSLNAWASLAGYMASLPVQMVKPLLELAEFMGPFGLFVIWLLVMLPFVLAVRLFVFFKNLIIKVMNLVIDIIRLIGDIWDLIPGL